MPAVSWVHRGAVDPEVDSPMPATSGAARPGMLYIGTAEELSQMTGELCAICLEKPGEKWSESLSGNVLRTELDVFEIFRQVELCLSDERRVLVAEKQFLRVVREGKGLQQLIESATEVIGNPVILVDCNFKTLAVSVSVPGTSPDLKTQKQTNLLLEKYRQTLQENLLMEINDHIRETGYPYYSYDSNTEAAWINELVFADGVAMAQIGIPELFRRFERADYEIVEFLSNLIAMELQKSEFYRNNRGLLHSVLLSDLLDGIVRDEETAEMRATLLGWNLSGSYLLMSVFDSNYGLFDTKARLVSEAIQHLLPGSHWVLYENVIVFLIPNGMTSRELRDNKGLRSFLKNSGLRAGVGSEFSSLMSMRMAYDQSLRSYELGYKLRVDEIIQIYDSYVIYHIGSILSGHGGLRYFCHPAVLQIAERDRMKRSNLLETLEEYLQHIDDPGKAAENLFIHKNTLFYRIGRIKEEFGLDLSDGEERLRIQITLAFIRLGL